MEKYASLIPTEIIENKIYLIRGIKVMLDSDLARLYGVPTKRLNEAIKRNKERFPEDFMFQLTSEETKNLRFQNGIPNLKSQFATSSHGGRRTYPYAFTEQGVAMLSSVLKSKRAIQMNIAIVRAFIKLRELLATHKNVLAELEKIRRTQQMHSRHIANIWDIISKLINPPPDKKPKEPMGFRYRGK